MRTLKQTLSFLQVRYPLEQIAPLDKLLFIDIETTGFTPQNSSIYLIGVVYYDGKNWCIQQWFANQYEEENKIISAFFNFAMTYTHLIHFNGNNFDLPYVMQKCRQYNLPFHVNRFTGIDLYRRISPYKEFLHLPNCKQKTLEQILGKDRTDLSGGDLISVYHSYVESPTDYALQALTFHNAEDLKGMLSVTSFLSIYDLFNKELKPKKVQANYYHDIDGSQHQELIIKLSLVSKLPYSIRCGANSCYFIGEGCEGSLRVPLYEEEMMYFYSNYKNYYYLPSEDLAIHKSVASFVDKEHRIQASAATCYTKKLSTYLPQWEILVNPFFKRSYQAKETFFELTEERKKDRALFSTYASHLLHMLAVSQP